MGKLKNLLGLAGALPLVLSPRRVLWNTNTHKNRNMKLVSLCLGNFWSTATKNKISRNISQLPVPKFLNFFWPQQSGLVARSTTIGLAYTSLIYTYIHKTVKRKFLHFHLTLDEYHLLLAATHAQHNFLVRLCVGKHPAFPYPLGSVKLLWTLRFQHATSTEFNHHHNQSALYYLCYATLSHNVILHVLIWTTS